MAIVISDNLLSHFFEYIFLSSSVRICCFVCIVGCTYNTQLPYLRMTCHIVSSVWHMKDPVIAKSSAAFKYNQKYYKNDLCQLFFLKSKSSDQDVVKVGQALINDLRTKLQAFSTLHSPTSAQSSSVLHQFSKQQTKQQTKKLSKFCFISSQISLWGGTSCISNIWLWTKQIAKSTWRQHSSPGITHLLPPTIEQTILTTHRKDMWSHDGQGCIKCAFWLRGWLNSVWMWKNKTCIWC